MESIVSMGKNMKTAMNVGLKILGVTEDEVDVEIIQQQTKGIVGIGGKKAIIRLSKITNQQRSNHREQRQPEQHIEAIMDSLLSDMDEEVTTAQTASLANAHQNGNWKEQVQLEGKAWVENGELKVKNAIAKLPTVKIGNKVELYKNDEKVVTSSTIIAEKDYLEVICKSEQYDSIWKVVLDKNKLAATLEIKPGYKVTRTLKDVPPTENIELVVDEVKEIVQTVTFDCVMRKLEELHVSYGIDEPAIIEALSATEPSSYQIATGKKAEQGKNGWIELTVEVETKDGLIEHENGRVDFREIKSIPSVEQGQILAIIHPPIIGSSGSTVTGHRIPAKPVFEIQVREQTGVLVIGEKILSTQNGRPHFEQRGQLVKVSVIPKLLHDGNVDLSTGNIRFNGDVEITGGVEDHMEIEAGGDIVIHRTVKEAKITTSHSIITFGNIVGSELSAGKNNMVIAELGKLLGVMHGQVVKIIAVINQLTQAPAFKSSDFARAGLQPLLRILLEKKFQSFAHLAKKYVEISTKEQKHLDKEWTYLSDTIRNVFLQLSPHIIALQDIIILSESIKELCELSKTPVEPDSYMTISSALNSNLYCSGNIIIIGQGCVNTKIHAGGKLRVTGIVRGGELFSDMGMEVNEVGSNSSAKTTLIVPYDKEVRIKKAMEGTVVRIGSVKYTFLEDRDDIVASLNNQGKIVFR